MNDVNVSVSELLDHFETEGYCIIRNLLDPSVIEDLRLEIEQMVEEYAQKLLADHKTIDSYPNDPIEKRLMRLFENHLSEAPSMFRKQLHREGFYGLFFNRGLLDIVEKKLGEEILLYPNYTLRPKIPEMEAGRVLWHQDAGYTGNGEEVAQLRMVNLWTPLVKVNVENGCMQFIPGTHKLGAVPHVEKTYYLEIAEEELQPRLKDAINVELNPGDVVMFHNLLFHQGLPNHSDHIRWSLDWRYLDATQPTLRKEKGHIARSRSHPEKEVHNKQAWAQLSLT
ncbi:phytanoyl-CoA dioxygenase family protein [Paenibacillus montanisoli]|nr:phytanoyl-CoA dioxygenase family protein [Paenibacillus montanisoli]